MDTFDTIYKMAIFYSKNMSKLVELVLIRFYECWYVSVQFIFRRLFVNNWDTMLALLNLLEWTQYYAVLWCYYTDKLCIWSQIHCALLPWLASVLKHCKFRFFSFFGCSNFWKQREHSRENYNFHFFMCFVWMITHFLDIVFCYL